MRPGRGRQLSIAWIMRGVLTRGQNTTVHAAGAVSRVIIGSPPVAARIR